MGSWIGGDRDGNPYVTADVLRAAVASQSLTSFTHHLRRINALARELPISMRLVTPTPELLALAERSGDASPFRADEPYRRALRGMYARLFALGEVVLEPFGTSIGAAIPPPEVRRPPYERFDDLADDLAVIAASLRSHGAGALADDIVEPVRRSAVTFGAHLCGLDLRQNAAVHEVVIAELLAVAGVEADYVGPRRGGPRRPAGRRAGQPPAVVRAHRPLQRARRHRARRARRGGRRRHPPRPGGRAALRHLGGRVGERRARGGRAAARRRPAAPARPGAHRHRHRPAVRDDRRPHRQRRHASLPARRAGLPAARRHPGLPPGGDDRLLRLEQGRRLPRLELGAVGGAGTAGRRGRRVGRAAAAVPRARRHRRPGRRAGLRGDPGPAGRGRSTARSASPSRARWSPPSTPGRDRRVATSRPSSPPPSRRRPVSTTTSAPTAIASRR